MAIRTEQSFSFPIEKAKEKKISCAQHVSSKQQKLHNICIIHNAQLASQKQHQRWTIKQMACDLSKRIETQDMCILNK